ncbi:MAG TPA: hypothetical protein VK691_06705 [Solirubrobacteraceae bacterium]|jgi:hypothetical protein|nr:hypothetical protein [Solirubrobacteraceae bacterium]
MAYVVGRRGGRFEVRESFHTSAGPRSRTLAGFDVLSDDILAAAARRAQRPFDTEAVIRSARRAGARVRVVTSGASRARDRFLAGSRTMASTLWQPPPSDARVDAGTALLELLGFADMVAAGQPPRPFEPLAFPALVRLTKRPADAALAQRP